MTPNTINGQRLRLQHQRGISIVEILVGLAIALIGTIIMFQMMENWSERKRTTAAGSDAQISGALAMYSLERDIKQAGYGFAGAYQASTLYAGCNVSATTPYLLAPLVITDGAGGAPDTITTLYGVSTAMSSSQSLVSSFAAGGTSMTLNYEAGIRNGDQLIVASSAANCAQVSVTAAPTSVTINVAAPAGFAAAGGSVYNMGGQPVRNQWSVQNGRLTSINTLLAGAAVAEVAEGVINIQAQYGLDTDANSVVDTWQSTAPNWTQLRAVRIGVVARSQQYEKLIVTSTAPSWSGGAFTMTHLDGSAGGGAHTNPTQDWRHYRYRVYETTIPLRNAIWGSSP